MLPAAAAVSAVPTFAPGASVWVQVGGGVVVVLNVAMHEAHPPAEPGLRVKLLFCVPAAVESTSSSADVPFEPVNWLRSVAPAPAVTVIGESNVPTPANASSPATTEAVVPVVAVVP